MNAQCADAPPLEVQVVDFFSGCGGTSYGFATATSSRIRYVIRGAVDIDTHANATYQRMLGVTPLAIDARQLADPVRLSAAAADWGLTKDQPLLLIGCAPCQGFSSHRKKDGREDPRDTLVEAFATIATQLRPDIVVMENVPEMLQARHWEHFARGRAILEQAGYTVRVQIHNLAYFGVPQERFRALVVAARDWRYFGMPQVTHSPSDFVTVRQAIGWLPALQAGDADLSDPMHVTSRHRTSTVELIRMIPPDGGSRRSLPEGAGPMCLQRVDGFRDVYGRMAWDRPANAITARCRTPSCGRYAHPEQHRGLSVREAALLQGFPPDFHFEGPFDDKFKQIGNAVSPIFARAVANHLAEEWFADHSRPERIGTLAFDITVPIRKSFSSAIAGIKRKMRDSDAHTATPVW